MNVLLLILVEKIYYHEKTWPLLKGNSKHRQVKSDVWCLFPGDICFLVTFFLLVTVVFLSDVIIIK